ncbi:hypothetical protein ACVWZ3_006663 [Bradyrhizobium sp. i1.3.6]
MVPYCELSTTMTTSGASYCTAVANSWPFIRKQPSPAKATTTRSGYCRFASTAAGTPYPIEPEVGASWAAKLWKR